MSWKVPLGSPSINKGGVLKEVDKVLSSGWVAGAGPTTERFERALEAYLELPSGYTAVAVSSCTAALHLATKYYSRSIVGRPLTILCPSYSFVATATAPIMPTECLWMDIEREGCLIDAASIDRAPIDIAIPVHQYGLVCDIENLKCFNVVEDAACAFGARYSNGKFVGHSKNLVCFSFHARKTLTTGEGGAVIVPPHKDAAWIKRMRNFGMRTTPLDRHKNSDYQDPIYTERGFNFKMSELQAAFGIAQLEVFDDQKVKAKELAEKYMRMCDDIPEVTALVSTRGKPSWQNYRILLSSQQQRDYVRSRLRSSGIQAKNTIQPIHRQKCIKYPTFLRSSMISANDARLPNTIDVSNRGLWLPFHASVTDENVREISEIIRQSVGECKA